MLLEPSGAWTAEGLLALLVDPFGEEWRHKVGVAGPSDGSAKTSTRLLASGGWVLKTRTDQTFVSASEALRWLRAARARGRIAAIWHPEKLWAVIQVDGAWRPLTVCRELVTLRRLEPFDDRCTAWIQMIQAGIDVHHVHGLGLDLNPANFARDRTGRLFYLDEELYDDLAAHNVASAIVARIPEEIHALPAAWDHFGRRLRASLGLEGSSFTWEGLAEAIRAYPLAEPFEARRDALLAALSAPADRPRPAPSISPSTSRRWTCVLADVHGNLAALEAVLAQAREEGAHDYIFLGDAVGYGPKPAECVALLADLPGAIHVRGNHDHAISNGQLDSGMNSLARECAEWTQDALPADAMRWLASLPVEHLEEGWLAVHGSPKDPRRFFAYVYELTYEDNLRCMRDRRIPICFYGHTHVQLTHVELAGGPSKLAGERTLELSPRHYWLVNPGSVGQPRDGDPRAAYALWERRTGQLVTRRAPYDIERTIRELREARLPVRLEDRLRNGS